MALTKVTKSGITNNAIDADKLEDGTILAADITPGTITADKLDSTLNLSSKTVTLPNTSVTNAQLAGSIANAKLANSSLTINGSSVSLGSSISAGALDWQAVITADGSTGTTGVAGRGYFIDTTSAAHTFTLPVSAAIGDTIGIVDYAGTFATNALTIARNGHNIQGVANNSQLGTNRASVTLVYVDATKGWVYQNESNVADLGQALFITATGGTITTSGDFKIHTFTGDGCFAVSQVGNGPIVPVGGPNTVSYLVVAGGGAGGDGGGGGAGGFREGRDITPSYTASPLVAPGGLPVSATTYPITVGAGGAVTPNNTNGGSGSNSVFSTITSTGGGGGSRWGPPRAGTPGGSGGGGAGTDCGSGTGGAGNTPPTSPSQGNNGGNAPIMGGTAWGAGGGGGAGAVGASSPGPSVGANGGAGVTSSINGTPTARAGGGGGGSYVLGGGGTGGTGGSGGGGNGGRSGAQSTAGSSNTGGGGGGAGNTPGGIPNPKANTGGGKGIVVIRYKFQ